MSDKSLKYLRSKIGSTLIVIDYHVVFKHDEHRPRITQRKNRGKPLGDKAIFERLQRQLNKLPSTPPLCVRIFGHDPLSARDNINRGIKRLLARRLHPIKFSSPSVYEKAITQALKWNRSKVWGKVQIHNFGRSSYNYALKRIIHVRPALTIIKAGVSMPEALAAISKIPQPQGQFTESEDANSIEIHTLCRSIGPIDIEALKTAWNRAYGYGGEIEVYYRLADETTGPEQHYNSSLSEDY